MFLISPRHLGFMFILNAFCCCCYYYSLFSFLGVYFIDFLFLSLFFIYINIYIMEYENKLGDRKAIFLVEASRRNNVLFDNYL